MQAFPVLLPPLFPVVVLFFFNKFALIMEEKALSFNL